MDQRTQAEHEYDAQKDGSAYARQAAAEQPDQVGDLVAWANAHLDAEEQAPPIPAGMPLSQAIIARWYGDVFITIDRRDGELVICRRDELGSTALAPDFVIALFKCFQDKPIRELLAYHWRQQMERDGSPLMRDLLAWIDGHFAAA